MIPKSLKSGKGYALVRAEDASPGGSATIYIYDVIGPDFWTGTGLTAKQVIDDLAALGDVKDLAVRINSPGGDVFEGLAIYNALARFPGNVTVHIDGIAASIASVVAMAGDEILIAESAMMMIHRPWTIAIGDGEEMRRTADMLDKTWSSILTTYARRSGRRAESIAQKVTDAGGEWWLTAEEAVSEKLADEATEPTKDAQAFGLAGFRRVPAKLAASAVADGGARPSTPSVLEVAAPRVIAAEAPTVPTAAPAASSTISAAVARRRREVEVLELT